MNTFYIQYLAIYNNENFANSKNDQSNFKIVWNTAFINTEKMGKKL